MKMQKNLTIKVWPILHEALLMQNRTFCETHFTKRCQPTEDKPPPSRSSYNCNFNNSFFTSRFSFIIGLMNKIRITGLINWSDY